MLYLVRTCMGQRRFDGATLVRKHRRLVLSVFAMLLIACVACTYQFSKHLAADEVEKILDARFDTHKLYFLENIDVCRKLSVTVFTVIEFANVRLKLFLLEFSSQPFLYGRAFGSTNFFSKSVKKDSFS